MVSLLMGFPWLPDCLSYDTALFVSEVTSRLRRRTMFPWLPGFHSYDTALFVSEVSTRL
jgi:hypothetical protein